MRQSATQSSISGLQLLEAARDSANKGYSIRTTALELNLSVQTLKNRLISASMKHQQVIPNFNNHKKAKKKLFSGNVRSSGRAGRGLRVNLPSEAIQAMNWESGSQLKVEKKGSKLVISAS